VAIKVLRPEDEADRTALRRFGREARAIAQLDHQHIVSVYDIRYLPDGSVCLVMEYLKGHTLQARLDRDGPLSLPTAVRVLVQTARGLGAAHACGLVHRDVSPLNIMLVHRDGRDDFVKVLDFGLVKAASAGFGQSERLTLEGAIVGTPAYASPEQVRSAPVDHRADVYGLGMVAYAMVCGRPAYTGHPHAVIFSHVTDTPRPPRELRPDLPPEAAAAILRALAKEPEDRFVAVEEFASTFGKAVLDTSMAVRAIADEPSPEESDVGRHARQHALGVAATAGHEIPNALRVPAVEDELDDPDATEPMAIPEMLRGIDLGDD